MYDDDGSLGELTNSRQIDELWESMCQSAISLIERGLPKVDNDEKLLKIKGVVALFVQTMDVSASQALLQEPADHIIELGILSHKPGKTSSCSVRSLLSLFEAKVQRGLSGNCFF